MSGVDFEPNLVLYLTSSTELMVIRGDTDARMYKRAIKSTQKRGIMKCLLFMSIGLVVVLRFGAYGGL